MTDLHTARLVLHPVDVEEGQRIVARRPTSGDRWAEDFPFDGDIVGVTAFLMTTDMHGDQGPFGHYLIRRAGDGLAIGGIGFKGSPVQGRVEVGYGLAPSGRGHGYAAEALTALVDLAAAHGLRQVVADTTPENLASRRTLEHAGFTIVEHHEDLVLYELDLVG